MESNQTGGFAVEGLHVLNTVTNPMYFSSSKLYTRDFFRLVKAHLRDDGVYTTWIGTTVGNLGFEKVEFPKPVFHGDTIYSETEVVEKRESKSRPQWGIVVFEHRAKNQHGDVVMRCRRAAMMRRRAA